MKKGLQVLAGILNAALALLFGAVIFNLIDARIIFKAGENFQEYLLRALFAVFIARLAVALAEAPPLRTGPIWRRAAAFGVFAAGAACMHLTLLTSLVFHTTLFVAHRASRWAPSDEKSLEYMFEYQRWQHRPTFIHSLLRDIPENEGIAYFSDIGPYVFAAQVYPRPVYMLPEIFGLLFETDQFDWRHRADPMHPKLLRQPGAPAGFDDPAVMERLRKMLAERKIQWVVVYDGIYPEHSFYRRLPGK